MSWFLQADGQTYISSPPPYAAIFTERSSNNIQDFISMEQQSDPGFGTVMDFQQFVDFVRGKHISWHAKFLIQ